MHSKAKGSARPGAVHAQPAEQIQSAQELVASILQKSTTTLEEEEERSPAFMRWELGACWVQHLQSEAATLKEKKDANAKEGNNSDAVSSSKAGVKPVGALSEQTQSTDESTQDASVAAPELAVPEKLMKHLPSCALARLNESANSLQCKVFCVNDLPLNIACSISSCEVLRRFFLCWWLNCRFLLADTRRANGRSPTLL